MMSTGREASLATRLTRAGVADVPGAERLLGQGHLAAKLSGEGVVVLAQVPFLEEEGAFSLAESIARAWGDG